MVTLFGILLFVSFILLIVGLIYPKASIYWGDKEKRTRKRVLLYYGLGCIVLFILVGATAPEPTPEEKAVIAQERLEAEEKKAEEKRVAEAEKAEEERIAAEKAEEEAKIKAEQEQLRLEEEQEKLKLEVKTLKEKALSIDYKALSRNPDDYTGAQVVFVGQVIQVLENGNQVELRVNTKEDECFGYLEDTIYVFYERGENEGRILEEDKIVIYGDFAGLLTYETVLGSELTIPSIDAKIIQLVE